MVREYMLALHTHLHLIPDAFGVSSLPHSKFLCALIIKTAILSCCFTEFRLYQPRLRGFSLSGLILRTNRAKITDKI